jgi:hypothetical protein
MRDKVTIMGKGKRGIKVAPLDDTEARECSGKSLLEMLQDRLDEYIDELMDEEAVANMKKSEVAKLQGTAAGLTEAIAIILMPYLPNVDGVRDAAMERYEERNA